MPEANLQSISTPTGWQHTCNLYLLQQVGSLLAININSNRLAAWSFYFSIRLEEGRGLSVQPFTQTSKIELKIEFLKLVFFNFLSQKRLVDFIFLLSCLLKSI
jgi:hypothetical protein